MRIVGIIAEYNPFHNGHLYHIQKAKQLANADYAIVVMSGNFVQRGTPAITDKYTRAKMALYGGADLVVELPVYYATASAELFAYAAVTLLDKLNVVDTIVFGSESGQLDSLEFIADFLINEPEEYRQLLKGHLANGISYPAARQKAFTTCCSDFDPSLLTQPNEILGIEYCKAIRRRNSHMRPLALKRTGDAYHSQLPVSDYCSATSLRNIMQNEDTSINHLENYIPKISLSCLHNSLNRAFPIFENDFSLNLNHALLLARHQNEKEFLDVSNTMLNRIFNNLYQFLSYTQFIDLVKTKQLTYTRISRGLLHILLNISQKDIQFATEQDTIFYARILGFQKSSAKLIKHISDNSSIPLITKIAGIENYLSNPGLSMLKKDIFAADLYCSVATNKFHQNLYNEYNHPLEIV